MKKKAGNFIVFAIAQKCGHFLLAFFMQIVKVHSNFWKKHNKVIFSALNYYDMLFWPFFLFDSDGSNNVRSSKFDVRSFEAKNRVFEFDYH